MQGKEYELVNQLAVLLRKNGDRILNGESKLSLTTQSLSLLNVSFRRYSESKYGESSRNKKYQEQLQKWKFNVQYLHDFITKTVSLKITHSSATMQGPIFMSRFRNVQVLELKRVPIHMLEGLHRLRGQIRTIIVSRCLNSLQDLFEVCGGDQSSPMSWSVLKSIFLSYNGIKKLDSSLRLLPVLEVIDVSHNDIDRTENCLEHLTDISRVNLGFNSLDCIPSFSLTAKSRIKTLVLRNNNLDNIEGMEELSNIEELDLAENCLCDHSCLTVLSCLNKLVTLSLQGNPLSFHTNHRCQTLEHVSVASASSLLFVLDGKKITSSERQMSQKSVFGSSRRPSQDSQTIIASIQRDAISSSYTFEDSDGIATSLRVGSPGQSRSKKKKSRPKTAVISDEEVLDSSMTEYSSRESSRVPSPETKIDTEDKTDAGLSTKEEIQVIRDHYGENWLQVITAKHEDTQASSYSSRGAVQTEDDIYLNDSTANLSGVSPYKSGSSPYNSGSSPYKSKDNYTDHNKVDGTLQKSQNRGRDLDDDIEVLTEPDSNKRGEHEDKKEKKRIESEPSFYSIYRQQSSQGSEWKRMEDEEQTEYYGAESEPFIVMLPAEKLKQLIVSVNNRYLIEKDLNGEIVELLDLKCLLTFVISMETVAHENISEDISLPVCKFQFDYLRKDRRVRKYVMEDSVRAKELQDLLQPFLDAREIDRQMRDLLQCLKCSNQFNKSTADVMIDMPNKKDITSFANIEPTVRYKCPKCSSEMVVELDVKELPISLPNTPVGSLKSSSILTSSPSKPITNGNTLAGSPMAKSSPRSRRQSSTTYDVLDGPPSRVSTIPPPVMSNSDMIKGGYKETSIQKSYSTGSAMCDMDKITKDENPEYTRNGSWSDFTKSMESHHIKKRASMDSDITILTNDSSSIAVISESSYETVPENKSDDVINDKRENKSIENLLLPVGKLSLNSSQNSTVENVPRKLAEISEESTVITPIGSPLSSSICSSMVSSIYENTVTSPSSENIHQETIINAIESPSSENLHQKTILNLFHNGVNTDKENNNGHKQSIYDVYNAPNDNGNFNSLDTGMDNRKSSQNSEGYLPTDTNILNDEHSIIDNSADISKDSDCSDYDVLKSYCDIDFTKIDHRLKLFITMNFLEENDKEKLQCALKVDIMQYLDIDEFPGYLVISNERILIFRFTDEENSDDYDTCLKCIENQPITELQYIDIGLGYQSIRFEFSTECSSYTFIIRDEGRCKQFMSLVTSIVQDTAFSENSKLEGISKYNAVTMDNLTTTILKDMDEEDSFQLVKYLSGVLVSEEEEERVSVGLAITEYELILVKENQQWPLPRLQASLDEEIKGQQFTIKDRQKINNIATVETCEDDTTQIRLTFFNEESQQEVSWHISMETDAGVLSLVSAIREPWENEFGVDLDVTPVSFLPDS